MKARLDSDDLAFIDIFVMLLRHKWVILATVLIFVLGGVRLSLAPRQYAANSMLRVQPGVAGQYRASQPLNGPLDVADQISPYVDILESRTLFLRVARDLDLANNSDFVGGPILRHQSMDDVGVREGLLRIMRARISVTHKPKDEIIRVICSTPNAALSANVVNTLVNDFVEYLVQVRYGASKRSSGWLISQLDGLKLQVGRDQAELTALQSKLGIVGLNDTNNDYLAAQSLNTLTKAGTDATVERILAEAKYRFLQESDPGLIEGEVNLLGSSAGTGQGLLQTLRLTQATQASAYAKQLEQFGPNYPGVKQLKAQLDETNRQVKAEQARILNQAKLSFSAAAANENMTDKELADKQNQSFGQHGDMVKYILLEHDYQSHRTLYESLVSRLQEASITAGLESGEVDIVDLADIPKFPAPPGRLTYIAGSLLAGLALGCILALLTEAVSTRIVTSDQAGRASNLPALAVVPHFKGQAALIGLAQDTPYVEAIEALRTTLVYGSAGPIPKVLLVTSAISGEGKAALCENLATILAQHGASVLLVDCDIRHTALASRFGVASDVGLSGVLAGKSDLNSSIQTLASVPGLKVLTSGTPVDVRAAVLLGSPAMQAVIDETRKQFDFVILHGAPTLGVSDVLNVGRLVDGVLFVIRSRKVTRKGVKSALQILENAGMPLLGYVLNDFRPEFREAGYKAFRKTVAADAKGSAA
jgi:capsular exopolysaccharide synthesis family protein